MHIDPRAFACAAAELLPSEAAHPLLPPGLYSNIIEALIGGVQRLPPWHAYHRRVGPLQHAPLHSPPPHSALLLMIFTNTSVS